MFALHEKVLGDSAQQLLMKPDVIAEWYGTSSVLRHPQGSRALVEILYDLNDVDAELGPPQYDYDAPVHGRHARVMTASIMDIFFVWSYLSAVTILAA